MVPDCGRGLPDDTPPFWRVVVTDGTSEPLKDKSVLVFRVNTNISIDANNVCEVYVLVKSLIFLHVGALLASKLRLF